MAYDDERDERFDDFDEGPPPKRGMSGGTKVLLIILAIFGGFALLCCGGLFYFGYKIQKGVSQDPTVVKKVTQEIAAIDIPEKYTPKQSIVFDMPFMPQMKMKMVIYQGPTPQHSLTMMEFNVPPEELNPGQREEARQKMKQQGQNVPQIDNARQLQAKEFTINGKKARFEFQKGNAQNTDVKVVLVSGTFQGKNGAVMLFMQIPEDDYKEDEVVKMLKSIK